MSAHTLLRRVSEKPAAALAFFFSIGIALSLLCREYSFGGLASGCGLVTGSAFLSLRRNRPHLSLMLALWAIALCGLLLALAERDGFPTSDLRYLLAQNAFPLNEPVFVEGCVVAESEERGGESVSTVSLNAFRRKDDWIACRGKGILRVAGSARESSPAPGANLKRGDRIRAWASWRKPDNFENPGSADRTGQLARRGVFLLGRVKTPRLLEITPGGCASPWTQLANCIRARVHSSIGSSGDKEDGQPAAVLASLVIGDYSGLSNATREIFQNSGTFHVLVVSGLHVVWIAGVLLQLFKLLRLPERARYLIAACTILLYTCVVGFQASITRCLWMFLLYLIGRTIFRRADPLNILLSAAFILLAARPNWLFETGFQLSFLSVIAIVMTAVPAIHSFLRPVWDPLRHCGDPGRLFTHPGRFHRLGRTLRVRCEIAVEAMADRLPAHSSRLLFMLCRALAGALFAVGSTFVVSLSIQIWLEPLLACSFNRISWIAPLANLLMVPLSSIVLAAGIIASLMAGIPHFGPFMLGFAGSLASLLLSAAAWITAVPGAWQRCPTPSAAWITGSILLLFVWAFFGWRRLWMPCACIIILLACLAGGSVPLAGNLLSECRDALRNRDGDEWSRDSPVLNFTFLDVGEGDSIVIQFPDTQLWLVDAGGMPLAPYSEDSAGAFDIGEAVVSRYLWHQWIARLDRLVLSHPDMDHAGGMPAVMENFRVAGLSYPTPEYDAPILGRVLKVASERRIRLIPRHAGIDEAVGPVRVRTIHPPVEARQASANENSLVLHFSYKRFSALLTGDLEKSGERDVISRPADLQCRLLKVAHHGSRAATTDDFLSRAQPGWAIVSAGRNNPFGHPSPEVLNRLRRRGIRPILTMDEGAVTFETDGNRYAIRTHLSGLLERGKL